MGHINVIMNNGAVVIVSIIMFAITFTYEDTAMVVTTTNLINLGAIVNLWLLQGGIGKCEIH